MCVVAMNINFSDFKCKMEAKIVLLLCYIVFAETVSVNVPSTRTANVSLQTEETLLLNVTGTSDYQNYRICDTICEISSQNPVKSKSCTVHETNILATLESKIAYKGLWSCTVKLKQIQPESRQENGNDDQPLSIHFTLNISVKESAPTTSLSSDQIIIIAIAVSTIVGIIIIGQTICIIHFKKKARRALIDKHLTPKNTINEGSSTDRYVNKKSGKESGKGETDEGIYEALESTRDEPPPPPSLATLPVTPKPQHLMRSASQSNLLGVEASTTPRPSRNHQNPGRFNTVARSCSLERIRKRPPQPLPTESSIYEDVTPEKISPTKHKFFGVKSSPVGPKTGPVPMSSNRPVPGKPSPAFPDRQEFLKPQGLIVGRPPIANKFPAGAKPEGSIPLPSVISGAKPMAAMPLLPVGPGAKPVGGVPLLPSMISAAKLKPVNKTKPPPPPVTERPRHPQALSPPSTIAKPYKPKPSVPLPEPVREEPEPIPEDFESVISDDSDDEFKCYDVLPDYTIYGNGAY